MSTYKPFQLLKGEITYDEACTAERNMLRELSYPDATVRFFEHLSSYSKEIQQIVSLHLGLHESQSCRLGDVYEWRHGSYNVCIPIYIRNWNRRLSHRILIRFPLPFKAAESRYPGTLDEKVRSEVATFIWLRQHCPDVRTPHVWGFGFSNGLDFTALEHARWHRRLFYYVRCGFDYILGKPFTVPFCSRKHDRGLQSPYILEDFIDASEARMLSDTWHQFSQDSRRRQNLFQGLSRIMLSLNRISSPRIGSLTLNAEGVLSVGNRPLTTIIPEVENDGCPRTIETSQTYTASELYYLDLLDCHDSRIQNQPNSCSTVEDGRTQIAAITMMRAVMSQFVNKDLRLGPFFLNLPDLHRSNIFVDDDWHIRYLIDFEWSAFRPLEMQRPPLWLTDNGVDEFEDENLASYAALHEEFLSTFAEEERKHGPPEIQLDSSRRPINRAELMRHNWSTGRLWYFLALESPTALSTIFGQHIEPRFAKVNMHFDEVVSPFWNRNTALILDNKLEEKEKYDEKLREVFANIA